VVEAFRRESQKGRTRSQNRVRPETSESHYDLLTQSFEYDSLNRLQRVADSLGSPSWQQKYVYDRYGNRTVAQGSNETFGTGIPKPYFAVDTTNNNNRLIVPSGFSGTMHYDGSGNLDIDTYSALAVSRLYDAENRMTKETQANSYEAGVYAYDGDGHRLKRKVGSVETWQVYGIGGELLAEYAANTAASSPQKEYGYRNGQLLITTTRGGGYGAPPVLNDNPLVVGETTVQARHISELRTAINTLRAREGISAYSWTTSATTSDWIKADPILEMRTALDRVLGPPPSGYSSGLASGQPIKAVHIQELRDRLLAAWSIDIRWLVTDQLGSPRMIFDQSGSLSGTSRHDYLPFGEELYAGVGGRSITQGYSLGDGARQKFTQKERDNETGLDYFLARYYSSTQGRFASPDEFTGGPTELFADVAPHNPTFYAEIAEPQSLNKYHYALNNPLRYLDPDGHQSVMADATNVAHATGQTLKDTGVGTLKGVANLVIDTANAINHDINTVAPGTVSYGQRFEPSTEGERGAMFAVNVISVIQGVRGAVALSGTIADASRTAAITQEMRSTAAPESAVETMNATAPYKRPTGATTAAQRASVQGQPCAECGRAGPRMFADHKEALVKEYYRTGTIDRTRMKQIGAVQPHCPTCSSSEGGRMARYSNLIRETFFK
jgi:RHS repeat-associated protein